MRVPMLAACLLIVPLGLLAGPPRQATGSARQTSPRAVSSPSEDPGERIFAVNCSRCHQAPMGLPPRITGTVIMHMRTRARLSRQDERSLLKYLAP
jgi:mono/diheme cytochrome c family protein